MNESELIAAAKNGDVESFNRLVLEYQDMAYSVAYRIASDADIAADATQNAIISAYRKLHQFKGKYFKAWLMRIVTNACYDELRRLKRRPVASLDKIEEESDGFDYGDPGETPMMGDVEMPEQALQQQELQAAIEDCIRALGETHRGVVVFADVEGYSYEETAEILDISLGTVKSRLSRARARLRDCLQEKEELLPAQYRL